MDKMQKGDPVITYNHMEEDTKEKKNTGTIFNFKLKNKVAIIFIAEEILIALLLALIFYMI
ncbi:MAG: hypothetical protein ABI855_08070 [Bacteroidota bacterium]